MFFAVKHVAIKTIVGMQGRTNQLKSRNLDEEYPGK